MKVVNIVTQEEAGGAQRVAFQLSQQLNLRSHSTRLLFLYKKRHVVDFEPISEALLDRPYKHIGDWAIIAHRLYKYLKSNVPDAVICHTHYSNLFAIAIAWIAGVKVRVAVHHSPANAHPCFARIFEWILGGTRMFSSHVMVSVSVERSFARFRNTFSRKVCVVLNGVDEPCWEKITAEHLPFSDDMSIVLNVGRLSYVKNQKVLLHALRQLHNVALVLVGEGKSKTELHEEACRLGIRDRVFFAGEVERDRVWSYLLSSQVFAFTSMSEALGLALVEAMIAGVPIVAGDLPATRELLTEEDGRHVGLIVKQSDATEVAKAIRMILRDKKLTSSLTDRAKERSRKYSVDSMVDGYEQILYRLSNSRIE